MNKEEAIVETMQRFLSEIDAVEERDELIMIELAAVLLNCHPETVKRWARRVGALTPYVRGIKMIARHDVEKIKIHRRYKGEIRQFYKLLKTKNL